jgi:hypothetical protein
MKEEKKVYQYLIFNVFQVLCKQYYFCVVIEMKFKTIKMMTLYWRTESQSCCIVFLQFNTPSVHKNNRQFIYIQRNTGARWCNQCCCAKAIRITYSQCMFVAWGIQYERRMCHIISSVARPALQYFSTLYHKRFDFLLNNLLKKCVFWFSLQLSYETFHILGRNERDIIKRLHVFSCKVAVITVTC